MSSRKHVSGEYEGVKFKSRRALARHLATTAGRSVSTIETLLKRNGDNVDAVLEICAAPRWKPVKYSGQEFSTRKALAKHLSPTTGRSARAVEGLLYQHGDNVDAVLEICAVPNRWWKPLEYDSQEFPSRQALARHLAPKTGRSVGSVYALLYHQDDDVDIVLEICRNNAPRCKPVTLGARSFKKQVDFCRWVADRYGFSSTQVEQWMQLDKLTPEQVVARAKERTKKVIQARITGEVWLFGWRFGGMTALSDYYRIARSPKMQEQWRAVAASGNRSNLLWRMPVILAGVSRLWDANLLDERNRRVDENRLPPSCLPLDTEMNVEMVGAQEHGCIDCLNPGVETTPRRSIINRRRILREQFLGKTSAEPVQRVLAPG